MFFNIMGLVEVAKDNLDTRFIDNPCRGIVLGRLQNGKQAQFPWTMGRSKNSKNRVYIADGASLRTEAFDLSQVEDPTLIIYNAMAFTSNAHIVSNGDQTDTVYRAFTAQSPSVLPDRFAQALRTRYCEPDPIIFTNRISGYQHHAEPGRVRMSVVRANPFAKELWIAAIDAADASGLTRDQFKKEGRTGAEVTRAYNQAIGERCGLDPEHFPSEYDLFEREAQPGFGYCVTTYVPGSKDLNPFESLPFLLPLKGDTLEEVMQTLWGHLEPLWKVSIGGKEFDGNGYRMAEPINQIKKV